MIKHNPMLNKYLNRHSIVVLFCLSLINSVLFGQMKHQTDVKSSISNGDNAFLQLSYSIQPDTRSSFLSVMGTKNSDLRSYPSSIPVSIVDKTKNYKNLDAYYVLNCKQLGFTGYFDPQRWQTAKIFGDGGVDVTGAPNCKLLVQKADNALLEVANHQVSRFNVVMPASGYVSFNWRRQGGSYSPQGLSVLVGNKNLALNTTSVGAFIQAGSILSFQLDPTSNETFVIEHFSFVTEADEVLVRQWRNSTATETAFTEYIYSANPSITDISFPKDCRQPLSTQPDNTGFPTYDIDGNPSTVDDLVTFQHSTKKLMVSWKDVFVPEQQAIFREWTITDLCGNNVRHQTQRIFLEPKPLQAPMTTVTPQNSETPVQDLNSIGLMLMD
jgi:hypothetical protein